MESVGGYLKKKREAKAISLSEVARLTKISKFYLDYIEKDEFEKLPQGPYIKGYISSYSEQIGSDVDEALQLYDALNQKEELSDTGFHDNWEMDDNEVPPESEQLETNRSILLNRLPVLNRLRFNSFSILPAVVYSSAAVLATTIVVLAGFGFYHLFLFEKKAPAIAQSGTSGVQATDHDAVVNAVGLKRTERLDLVKSANPQQPAASKQEVKVLEPDKPTASSIAMLPIKDLAAAAVSFVEEAHAEEVTENPPMPEISAPIEPEEPTASVNLEVLKANVCTDVQDRVPVGVSTVFPSSTQRVYVWSQIKAEEIPTEIRHIYYFENRKIGEVELTVRSNVWRTWSYKTLSGEHHSGQWRIDIVSKNGSVLQELNFTIN